MQTIQLFEPGVTDRIQNPLDLLRRCGGYYKCPKDPGGKRLGPLVGYAGRYEAEKLQYVGDEYVNFAKAERHAPILKHLAGQLISDIWDRDLGPTLKVSAGFIGAPEGGKALACALAQAAGRIDDEYMRQYIFPEKVITAVATPNSREVSKLVFDRHEPEAGEFWWITEDVCNNFSTTAELVALIESHGAHVAGILCFLNRSLDVEKEFSPRVGLTLPVIPLVRQRIMQYQQDDVFVAADVAARNVVWKPKKREEWQKLAAAMEAARKG
ncbi:MAG: hypothetical protein AAB391_01505 [Patescibacteria group bacterium]